MKLAVYKQEKYEYEDVTENKIRLLSNTWQEDFYEYKKEENYYYAKEVDIEELELRSESTIYLKMGTEKTDCLVYDAADGETVGFLYENHIPEKLKVHAKKDNCFAYTMPFKSIRQLDKNAEIRYRVGSPEDDSYTDRKLLLPIAVDVSARILRLSADKSITTCRSCGMAYPVKNADVKYGEIYETTCPVCGVVKSHRRR